VTFSRIPGRHHQSAIDQPNCSQRICNKEALYKHQAFIPSELTALVCIDGIPSYAHFASLMVHPVTGEMISSYKKRMHYPAMADVWQSAFGNYFG
jgi:hypothetical protein